MKYLEMLKKLLRDESGQDLMEYALVAVLISVASIAAVGTFAAKISSMWSNLATQVGSLFT
jgi:pilus assembly protein Flp/PilA